ncbi:MAG: hypothetical protein II998_09585 [Clostridia bacterium]|nr:hypothetical protein [Clostridia bacterium]
MPKPRRKYKLADINYRNVDLRMYSKLIIDNINSTVPGKNPQVFESYFSTDLLTQSESVLIGRALAKLEELKPYGKTITIFRLFDGKAYAGEESNVPIKKKETVIKATTIKGGRVR